MGPVSKGMRESGELTALKVSSGLITQISVQKCKNLQKGESIILNPFSNNIKHHLAGVVSD